MREPSRTVTRILYAESQDLPLLEHTARVVGSMRKDLWQKFGGCQTFGRKLGDCRKRWSTDPYKHRGLDGTVANESAKDIINDIFTYREAAMLAVYRDLRARLLREGVPQKDAARGARERLGKLSTGEWLCDSYLHRRIRKRFQHGRGHADNQFIVRSDKQQSFIRDGVLIVQLRLNGRFVELITNSNGTNVRLGGRNLRIILRDGKIEIHYAFEKPAGRPHGKGEVGCDKGYTENVVDSNGLRYGERFGVVMTEYSDKVNATGKARNKLQALLKKHEAAGRTEKAEHIRKNNLGRVKLIRRRKEVQSKIKDMCYKTAHALADNYEHVITEDLTWQPKYTQNRGKNYNRRMSGWRKGVLASALAEVFAQRGVCHSMVNAAYTSQIDSRTGRLEGELRGDWFYCVDGEVLQRDENAARNIKARFSDPEITRYMTRVEVKKILLSRSSDVTDHQGAPVASCAKQKTSTECGLLKTTDQG